MRKIVSVVCIMVMLALASVAFAGEKTSNPVEDLTGNLWMQSSLNSKLAVIYGTECAITIEHFVAKEMEKKGKKKAVSTLSPFEKGWAKAFKGVDRKTIVSDIDKWYTNHPDQLDRPVYSVIWYELIAPKLK